MLINLEFHFEIIYKQSSFFKTCEIYHDVMNTCRSYALGPAYEDTAKMSEETSSLSSGKVESDDKDSGENVLPGVNLLFDGSELRPFDIGVCLQARQPASLISEASAVSASFSTIK